MDYIMDKLLLLRSITKRRLTVLPVYVIYGLMLLTSTVNGFNIDKDYPIRFTSDPNSYFGYSVAMLSNSHGNWVIVSAPKANSSKIEIVNEPGQVYRCQIDSKTCTEVVFQIGNERQIITDQIQYEDVRNNSWLGVSLDTTPENDGHLLACSHLWANSIHERYGYYFTNGLCYTINSEFEESTIEKLTPLIRKADQVLTNLDYKYAYAQAGIASQFVKGSDALLLGAPGIFDWKGSSVLMSREDSGIISKRSTLKKYSTRAVPGVVGELEYTAYFGYAVTSGYFLNQKEIQFVIGAPRQNYKGKICLVEIKNENYEVKIDRIGEQMGEYFGSAICAVDFDNNKLDDILVGAPLYSKHSDEGKVYVYKNLGNTIFHLTHGLMGSSVAGARFGSSIAVIGDVNMDSYPDVAIGAPYENDRGAVYIYHGSQQGLKSTYQQKLLAAEGSDLARGFGISIARGMDIDNNNYPDLVVGAYMSDEAFVFRTRPLVYLKGNLTTNRQQINMDIKECGPASAKVTCFLMKACVEYTGKFIPETINIAYILEVDTLKGNNSGTARVLIQTTSGQMQNVYDEATIKINTPHCVSYEVLASGVPRDYLTPIQMSFTYNMKEVPSPTPGFCKTCPLVDQSEPNKIVKQVRFQKHCGDDEKCDTDLQLQGSIRNFSSSSILIIGSQSKMAVQTSLYNAAEPAYAATLQFDLPSWMTIDQKPPSCDFTLNKIGVYKTLRCLVANPLQPKGTVNLVLNLNLEKVPLEDGSFIINITAVTDSNEDSLKLQDNHISFEVPVKMMTDVYVIGSTPNEQAFYHTDSKGIVEENSTAEFTHIYEVINAGPSPVKFLKVVINYPIAYAPNDKPIAQIIAIEKKDGARSLFGSCEGQIIYKVESQDSHLLDMDPLEEQQHRRRRNIEVLDQQALGSDTTKVPAINKESFSINCSTAHCANVTCFAGPFNKDTSAVLIITYEVNAFNMQKVIGKKDSALIFTEAHVVLSESGNQPKDHKADFFQVSTEVKSGGPPPPKEMAPWIIPVSVIGGILLLILLIVAMVKMGFFRRKTKEEMDRLKMMSNEQPANQDANAPNQNSALLDS